MFKCNTNVVGAIALALGGVMSTPVYASHTKEITLIHMGDLHGHTIPRPNLRSDGDGRMEGGLARMYTEIQKIRGSNKNNLLINTGDTTQGSGEALYTRGKALVDVVDMFGVDAFAAGNWEFVYGPERFKEFFGAGTGKGNSGHRWGALAGNLYNTAPSNASGIIIDANGYAVTSPAFPAGIPASLARVHTQEQYDDWSAWYLNNGSRILPPYAIKKVGGVKVGIIGCTTRRGPQVVGSWVVAGIEFTDCANEVQKFAAELRDPAGANVDLVVLITEIEVGVNIQMVRTLLGDNNHVDVILNSDMHEETLQPIEILNKDGVKKTLLIEEGQDGTMIGELVLKLNHGAPMSWKFKPHRISDMIREHPGVAKKVAKVRAPFTTAFDASIPCDANSPYYNTFSGTCLKGSLDAVVGETLVGLHRSGYTDEAKYSSDPNAMPAVLEGTSHDFIADAIRWWAGSDVATVRGFRYGTHVQPGPITRNDLYHFIPIGARIGKAGRIHVNQLRNQIDNSSQAVFSSNPISSLVRAAPYNNDGWAGGWMFAYSGENFGVKFDPYWYRTAPANSRARELTISLPCDRLPVAEQAGCVDRGVSQVTNLTNGAFMPNWAATLTAPVTVYNLQTGIEPDVHPKWQTKPSNAVRQNQLPVLTVAGYWYEQSPFKLNNCPNCNPLGLSADDNHPDAPYILPVNVDPATGGPMLDASGKPVLKRDELGDIVRVAIPGGENENRPVADGEAIELVEVIEKYLAANGPANPVAHRLKLLDGVELPGREVFGFPVMQPLCGTIPTVEGSPVAVTCPNQ